MNTYIYSRQHLLATNRKPGAYKQANEMHLGWVPLVHNYIQSEYEYLSRIYRKMYKLNNLVLTRVGYIIAKIWNLEFGGDRVLTHVIFSVPLC